jgi:hypothetical protein
MERPVEAGRVSKTQENSTIFFTFPANEGPVRIQYKCLVPIYVFSEMNLFGSVISKTEL